MGEEFLGVRSESWSSELELEVGVRSQGSGVRVGVQSWSWRMEGKHHSYFSCPLWLIPYEGALAQKPAAFLPRALFIILLLLQVIHG